ncbi:MAG: 4Fe-4S binding protein, partial [Lachnospiraceae bacterium]|nr:4Fe-4S binding protein [Lachnospiraceae bacterium]
EVDEAKCMACGKCVKVCPREVIRIHEIYNYVTVTCSNRDPGAAARKQCETSCIGCGLCEKTCTAGAITVQDNLAHIKEDLCLSCGMCAVKCPRGAISFFNLFLI